MPDSTYVSTWQGFVCVSFIIDVFVCRIEGWRVSASARTDFVRDGLEQALAAHCFTDLSYAQFYDAPRWRSASG